jgi:O-antigen/teichoic acid export membrane protein
MPKHLKALLDTKSLRWSFVGNIAGSLWQGSMSLISVPIFVWLLGIESFGLVGLMQTLQALLAIFDMGLAATANREVAILRGPEDRQKAADLVRTFEWVYWSAALLVGAFIAGLSGWVADSWVTKQSLPPSVIQMAVVLGGITLAARWPVALYTGVLRGLERQVLQNGILSAANTVRVVVTIAALLMVSRTIYCFLITQTLVNIGEALATGWTTRRLIDPGHVGRFHIDVWRRVWRFALSFNFVGVFGMLVSAADKLLITKLLPLSSLAYYSVCGTATGALPVIYQAASLSLFPRMAHCWHHQDLAQMNRLYLLNMRMTAYMCLGPVMLLCVFPHEILHLWTHSHEVADHAVAILPVLATMTMVNCASSPAYTILIATGHTRIPLLTNILSVPAMWTGCYFGIKAHGLMGAAVCSLVINILCFWIYGIYCRKKLFQIRTFSLVLGFPTAMLIPAFGIGYLAKMFLVNHNSPTLSICSMVFAIVLFYLFGLIFMNGEDRRIILHPVFDSLRRSFLS